MKTPLIQITEACIGYHGSSKSLLEGLNLQVHKGELIVLFGDNGAGKSTLLKVLTKHLDLLSGQIKIYQKSISEWTHKELSAQIALVLSTAQYSPLLSVREFISFGRFRFTNWLGVQTKNDIRIIEKILKVCGIEQLKLKRMNEISDGEKQKVLLARALAQETPILILDEPTTHLDVKNTMSILNLLRSLSKEQEKTIIFSSHRIIETAEIADKIWLFDQKTVNSIDSNDFLTSKKHREVIYGKENID